jgi:GNAT superfamily N-acetyltransferase
VSARRVDDWTIRPASAADAAELAELAQRTFRDAFAALNTADNMDLHCANAYSPALQATEIADPRLHTEVAQSDGRLVAFTQVHLRPEPPPCVSVAPAVELRRLYVERSFHGAGLARDLMLRVLATAASHGAAAVWLGVWEKNPRAIRFYERFGFAAVGDHVFVVGAEPQRDLVMVRTLPLEAGFPGTSSQRTPSR